MRRRALLAASAAGGGGYNWSYELHLEPEWYYDMGTWFADFYGDYSEVFNLAKKMCFTLGEIIGDYYTLDTIPPEFKIMVNGQRVVYMQYSLLWNQINGWLEDDITAIDIYNEAIFLSKV